MLTNIKHYFCVYVQLSERTMKKPKTVIHVVLPFAAKKIPDNRKGCAQWEIKAVRRIKTKVRNKRKINRKKTQKRSRINKLKNPLNR